MSNSNTKNSKSLQADAVIFSGGLSGLAAVEAAGEKGVKKIILLEKYFLPGGNGVFPEGLFASESQTQRRLAIQVLNDDIFNAAMVCFSPAASVSTGL